MFIDKEKFILRLLKKHFGNNDKYSYVFMSDVNEALIFLKNNKVDLLCSDIEMPSMDGFELFSKLKENYPLMVKIALSPFSKKVVIDKLLKEDLVNLFIFKPWKNVEIESCIEKSLYMKDSLKQKEVMNFINDIDNLPTLPNLYYELIEYLKENKDVDEISKLILKDQAITIQILKVANSAFYGKRTGSISQAIMKIGLINLKNIVLTSSLFNSSTDNNESIIKLWNHTMFVNKFTIAIYSECLNKNIPNIFSAAGLLHDVGKVIFYSKYKNDYIDLLNSEDSKNTSLVEIEYKKYGITHQTVGAYLLDLWNLPFAYVEAAMYHHEPFDKRIINRELLYVVHIADYYSSKYFMDGEGCVILNERVFEELNITKKDVEAVINKLK